jgi:hypothetical protein
MDGYLSSGVKMGTVRFCQAVDAEPGKLRYNKGGLTKDDAGLVEYREGDMT